MKNKVVVRFIPMLGGNTEIIYKGKKPVTRDELYDFIMSNWALKWYFPLWFRAELDTLTEEEILAKTNEGEDIQYTSLKEYILEEHIISNATFESIIKKIDAECRQYDNRIEVE